MPIKNHMGTHPPYSCSLWGRRFSDSAFLKARGIAGGILPMWVRRSYSCPHLVESLRSLVSFKWLTMGFIGTALMFMACILERTSLNFGKNCVLSRRVVWTVVWHVAGDFSEILHRHHEAQG